MPAIFPPSKSSMISLRTDRKLGLGTCHEERVRLDRTFVHSKTHNFGTCFFDNIRIWHQRVKHRRFILRSGEGFRWACSRDSEGRHAYKQINGGRPKGRLQWLWLVLSSYGLSWSCGTSSKGKRRAWWRVGGQLFSLKLFRNVGRIWEWAGWVEHPCISIFVGIRSF